MASGESDDGVMELLEGQPLDILCLSDAPWNYPLWTNRQYALSTLTRIYPGARVLYVETPTFVFRQHAPTAQVWPSGAAAIRDNSPMLFCREVQERIWVLSPPLPVPFRIARHLARPLIKGETLWLTKYALHRLKFRPPIFWAYDPYASQYMGRFGECFRMYECLDEHSETAFHAWNQVGLQQAEEDLMRAADIVFTVSSPLQARKSRFNPNTFMLGNPTNFALFSAAQQKQGECPYEFKQHPGPILGFYGALARYKINLDLVFWLAKNHPEWTLVLIGTSGHGEKLEPSPNLLVLPAKPQSELVRYVSWFDVLLMPYQQNEYTRSSMPLKLNEYFATGKPIVSTYIPPEPYRSLIFLANDNLSFARAIEQALRGDDPDRCSARIAIASQHTWADKVRNMISLMIHCGLLKRLSQ